MESGQLSLQPQTDANVFFDRIAATKPLGLSDPIIDGPRNVRSSAQTGQHPLEFSEKHYYSNAEKNDFLMLARSQGIHAPLHLRIERDIANKIQRLPCLTSSHLMSDILTGRLDEINFDDYLNNPMDAEIAGQPHILMERRAGI